MLSSERTVGESNKNEKAISPESVNDANKNRKIAVKKKKANYQSIFNQASDAIYICNIAGDFIDVNESFCRMFGYTAKEFLQMSILDVMEPEELKARPIAFARVATGQHLFGQRRMVKKNGEILDMEINIKMYDENCVMAIARDVTELRNTQKMIQMSEERFRGAFEHAAIGMALVSIKGEWLKVNKELCNIVGYTEQELLSLTFQQITHPDDMENDLIFLQQTLRGEREYYRMEKRYFHKNGAIVWINLNVTLVKDSQSQPVYFVSQIENITERKKSEEAHKKSEANLKVIFDTTDTAYTLVDKNLTIIAANKYAIDFAKNEIGVAGKVGDNLASFFLEERRPIIENVIPQVLSGRSITYEADYPQEDGSVHWYYVRLYPIGGIEKEIFGLMLAIDNITKRKEEELQKEETANELIIRNKRLEEFTHILSHNIRSHVARLIGLSDLLLLHQDINEQESKEIVSGISVSAKGLDEVVKNLHNILQFKN